MLCFAEIKRTLTVLKKDGIEKDHLILECMTKYPISRQKIETFIQHFFVERGIIRERDGVLYAK